MASPRATRFRISINRTDRRIPLPAANIRTAVRSILQLEQVARAEINIAIVDDETIHHVNREHLAHDCPTDVISFVYDSTRPSDIEPNSGLRGQFLTIEGELVVSAETAVRESAARGWPGQSELLLYIAHGLLHLCGYDDLSSGERRIMRRREKEVLHALGIGPIPR